MNSGYSLRLFGLQIFYDYKIIVYLLIFCFKMDNLSREITKMTMCFAQSTRFFVSNLIQESGAIPDPPSHANIDELATVEVSIEPSFIVIY